MGSEVIFRGQSSAIGSRRPSGLRPWRLVMRRCGLFIVAVLLTAAPAVAQVDFTGEWGPAYHEDRPERIPGPELGDYMGLPISDAARRAADSWDADRISVVTQYQCRPHSSDYGMRGLGN